MHYPPGLRTAAPRQCIGRSTALGASARSRGRATETSRPEGPSVRVVTAPTPPNLAGLDCDALATILCVELVRVVEGVQDEGLQRLAELATAGAP